MLGLALLEPLADGDQGVRPLRPTPSEMPSIGLTSQSSARTDSPLRASARASVPAMVVLPTPPLPATTTFTERSPFEATALEQLRQAGDRRDRRRVWGVIEQCGALTLGGGHASIGRHRCQ